MASRALVAVAATAVAMSGVIGSAGPATAASGVCTGVKHCKVVSKADVDGDGRSDRVGLVQPKTDPSYSRVTVRVRTAKGKTMSTSHRAWWYGSTWHGAAPFDGVAGRELVVGTDMGAHYTEYRVITVRRGKLVTLKAPGNSSRWGIDSSYSYNLGWKRTIGTQGKVKMASRAAERRTATKHTLVTNRYVWRSGTWAPTASKKATVSNKTAYAAGGWRVPPLKRFHAW